MPVTIDFCGEEIAVDPPDWVTIGRSGEVAIDDNPYLHRHFLQVGFDGDLCWIVNVGRQISATVSDPEGRVQAWLAPGARLPLVFGHTVVRFTAGPTTYELDIRLDEAPFAESVVNPAGASGATTAGPPVLTSTQLALILALAEPVLCGQQRGMSSIPSSADAARRLGWTTTRFNRKLDNVCQKLAAVGVSGLHGGPGELASNRRARLVEYAVASRLVTREQLPLLDSIATEADADASSDQGNLGRLAASP